MDEKDSSTGAVDNAPICPQDRRAGGIYLTVGRTIHVVDDDPGIRDFAALLLTVQGRHVERMSAYCRMLALRLGIPAPRAALIETASVLHDVGKLGIPDWILSKSGPLREEERRKMESHTTLGHRLLAGSSSELLELAATIALTHHERIDGRGYPQSLRGDEIPIEGRLAAICDVFDALTSSRPYRRRPFTFDEAIAIMSAERAGAFDPDLLDAFVEARYAERGRILSAA